MSKTTNQSMTNNLQQRSHASKSECEWICPDCGKTVEPLAVPLLNRTVYLFRKFCGCPAGQAREQAAEAARVQRARLEQQLRLTRVLNTGIYGTYRFSTWDDGLTPGARTVREQVEWLAEHLPDDGRNWVFISGGFGLGKTHLAIALLRKLAGTRLWKPHVVVWPELCDATRESWSSDAGENEASLWSTARAVDVLLIDDLDKTATSEWAMGKLFGLINYRYVRQRATIFTANHSMVALKRLWDSARAEHVRDTGGAVLSRIIGQVSGVIDILGEDQRRKK